MTIKIRLPFDFQRLAGAVCLTFDLPPWLPGFVRPYQVDGPRSAWVMQKCPWWRESRIGVIVPLLPPGLPSAYRSLSLKRRRRG